MKPWFGGPLGLLVQVTEPTCKVGARYVNPRDGGLVGPDSYVIMGLSVQEVPLSLRGGESILALGLLKKY